MSNIFQKFCKPVTLVLVISCFILFSQNSFSQLTDDWHQQDLDYGNSNNTWIYVALGILAAGAITYFIIKSSSSDDKSAQKKKTSDDKANSKTDSIKVEKTDSTRMKKPIEDK